MFDNNVIYLKNLIEEEFKSLNEIDQLKSNNFKLKALLKEKYLICGDSFIELYDDYHDLLTVPKNLIGYNRIINENGHFYEFYGFYIKFYNKSKNLIADGYILFYKNKDELCLYIPVKGNTIKDATPKNSKNRKKFLIKNRNYGLNFNEIKEDIYYYFFNNNDYVVHQKYDEDLIELFEAIKILADNNNINELIDGFNKKYQKGKK